MHMHNATGHIDYFAALGTLLGGDRSQDNLGNIVVEWVSHGIFSLNLSASGLTSGLVTDRAHGTLGAFAGTGVGFGTLATNGKLLAVANAPVGFDVLQTTNVLLHLTPQVALYHIVVLNGRVEQADVGFSEGIHATLWVDTAALANLERTHGTNPVERTQGNFNFFPFRNIYADNSWHDSIS
jgi:hypothetical protein